MNHKSSKSSSESSSTPAPMPTVVSTSPDVVPMDVDAIRTGRGKLIPEE